MLSEADLSLLGCLETGIRLGLFMGVGGCRLPSGCRQPVSPNRNAYTMCHRAAVGRTVLGTNPTKQLKTPTQPIAGTDNSVRAFKERKNQVSLSFGECKRVWCRESMNRKEPASDVGLDQHILGRHNLGSTERLNIQHKHCSLVGKARW